MKLLQLIPFLIFLIACGDDEPEVQLSKSEMLAGETSKTWKITGYNVDDETCPGAGPVFSDNVITFYSNGDFTHDEGTVTESEGCAGDFGDIESTWSFNDDETAVEVLIETGNEFFPYEDLFDGTTIKELTPTRLVLEGDDEVDPAVLILTAM